MARCLVKHRNNFNLPFIDYMELYLHSPDTPSWRGAQLKHRDNFTFLDYSNIESHFRHKYCQSREYGGFGSKYFPESKIKICGSDHRSWREIEITSRANVPDNFSACHWGRQLTESVETCCLLSRSIHRIFLFMFLHQRGSFPRLLKVTGNKFYFHKIIWAGVT
jgi:hypothetical protein